MRAFEVVLASGERLRVDAEHEPELFWALRGGGGRFAVVTALELEAHPVPEVSAGMLAWPAERAAEVLQQFQGWTRDAPEALGAVSRYLALPDLEVVPAPLRGRRIVAAIADRLEAVRERLARWTAPQALLNSSGGGTDPARAFDAATWERLGAVRDAFDPDRRLVSAYA